MVRPKPIQIVIILLILVSVFWVFTEKEPKKTPSVRIAVSRTPLSVPIFIADALGYFKSEGVNVELIEKDGGNLCFNTLMEGEADFATSSDSVIMFNRFKRQDFENLATFVRSDHDVKVISRSSLGIMSVKDLQGRKVALIKGSASEYFLDMLLAIDGVELNSIELVNLPPKEMSPALKNGDVDAIAVWEPFAYKAMQQLGDDAKLLSRKSLYELTFNLVTHKNFYEQHTEASEGVVKALKRAVEFINSNETEAQALLSDRLKLDQAFIDWVWGDYFFSLSLNNSLILSLENEARWAIDRGLTKNVKIPDYIRLMNPKALLKISPHTVSLKSVSKN